MRNRFIFRSGGARRVLSVAILAAIVLLPDAVFAQGAKLELDHLKKLAERAEEVVDIGLDATLLRLAAGFLSNDSPDEAAIKELVSGLKGIYVKSYKFASDGAYSNADVDAIRKQLSGWSRLVTVQNKREGENVEVYSRIENDRATGHAVVAIQPREVTVVNIVGTIDLAKLSALGGHFGIPRINIGETKRRDE